jgi:hypothetical protein
VSPPSSDTSGGVENTSDSGIRDDVLGYLREHPRAMDSLEGISQWWLVRQRVRVSVQLVARALFDLERAGLLERIGENGNAMYRLRAPADVNAGERITKSTQETPIAGGA